MCLNNHALIHVSETIAVLYALDFVCYFQYVYISLSYLLFFKYSLCACPVVTEISFCLGALKTCFAVNVSLNHVQHFFFILYN